MVQRYEALGLRVGQWKVEYNRERMISSGRQQTLDRSILTYPFAIVAGHDGPAVRAFFEVVTGPEGLAFFERFGFTAHTAR